MEIEHTSGFVFLTDGKGVCSLADGCGAQFSEDCSCDRCKAKGGQVADEIKITKGMTWAAILDQLKEGGIEPPKPGEETPSDDQIAAWKADSKAYQEVKKERRQTQVQTIIEAGVFGKDAGDELMNESDAQLEKYLGIAERMTKSSGETEPSDDKTSTTTPTQPSGDDGKLKFDASKLKGGEGGDKGREKGAVDKGTPIGVYDAEAHRKEVLGTYGAKGVN